MKQHAKDLDHLIGASRQVSFDQFSELIADVTQILNGEDGEVGYFQIRGRLVELPHEGEAVVVGDLHGDLDSLIGILRASDFMQKIQRGEKACLVFLGDYGDRGTSSVEVYYLILTLKKAYKENVVMIQGNHEAQMTFRSRLTICPFNCSLGLVKTERLHMGC